MKVSLFSSKARSIPTFAWLDCSQPSSALEKAANTCPLAKTNDCLDNELIMKNNEYPEKIIINGTEAAMPKVLYKFFSQDKHIVGIAPDDYTSNSIQNMYRTLKIDSPVEARLKIISYHYSDCPSALYLHERNALIIFCKILSMKQLE